MQKDHPETPKMRRVRRLRNPSTPEIIRPNVADSSLLITRTGMISRHRSTMAPSDFVQPQNVLPKRRIAAGRPSILPSQISVEGQKKAENDFNDMELKLLYDEYLQSIMAEIVIQKKTQEKKNLILTQLATIAMESDQDEEKLFKLKTRERDIINLIKVQNKLDEQLVEVTEYSKNDKMKMLKDTLLQLQSLLKPLDVLRCNDVILPETPEEWKETQQALKQCASTLKSIVDVIGSEGEKYKSIHEGVKDFIESHEDIETHRKKLEETLRNLQILILKNASLSLVLNETV
ncbi:hypothetical protein KM043_010740 [Ampulex compressa]|nr:hypothetical protein KM043_010740 [Ampulex compressa]